MGIKGLMKLIGDEAASCVKETEMKNYFGRKIAIDASMWYVLTKVRIHCSMLYMGPENKE